MHLEIFNIVLPKKVSQSNELYHTWRLTYIIIYSNIKNMFFLRQRELFTKFWVVAENLIL